MVSSILDADERAAIRAAMLDRVVASHAAPVTDNSRPIALIADTQSAARARPDAQRLAHRWCEEVRSRIKRGFGLNLEVSFDSVEVVAGEGLTFDGSWVAPIGVQGRSDLAMIVVNGGVIEACAAVLLGSRIDELRVGDRPPSPAALSVFDRVGAQLIRGLIDAWRTEQGVIVEAASAELQGDELRLAAKRAETLLRASLNVGLPFPGKIHLLAAPDVLAAPPPAPRVVPASRRDIEQLLGEVPVKLVVRLGKVSLPISELAGLARGEIIALDRSLQDPLALECGGVVAALGRPVIANGAIGFEITEITPPSGNRKETT